MVRRKLIVANKTGLHLRPAGKLCEAAGRYRSVIRLIHGGNVTDAKSVLSVLAAGIREGEEIELCCDGEDELQAADVIEKLFKDRFE